MNSDLDDCIVFGKLSETAAIEKLHPRFAKAFDFLKRTDLSKLHAGRYEIEGEEIFVNLAELELKADQTTVRFEAHRDYIDIQLPLAGPETFGIVRTPEAEIAKLPSADGDAVLWDDRGDRRTIGPGEFAVFFPPYGGHAPCLSEDGPRPQRKAIVKILAKV